MVLSDRKEKCKSPICNDVNLMRIYSIYCQKQSQALGQIYFVAKLRKTRNLRSETVVIFTQKFRLLKIFLSSYI